MKTAASSQYVEPSPLATLECAARSDRNQRTPLNVALFTNTIAPYSSPMLRRLTASLRELHLFVSVAMEPDRSWKPNWEGLDVTVQRSFMITHAVEHKQGYNAALYKHFPYDSLFLLRKCRPDVVISAQLGFRTVQAIIYRLLNRGSRLVIWADLSEHTERKVSRSRNLMRRLFLRFAHAVLVNGKSGARYIQSLGVPGEHIVQAPYTTDIDSFLAVPLTRDGLNARRLLYVGRLVESKGLDLFLPVLFEWATKHDEEICEFWIVGDGPERQRLERLQAPANVKIKFFGDVPYADLPNFYAQAAILALPSLSDTWGLVVNEAMASGLAIFGSKYSQAVEELVRLKVNGWTFYPDQPDDIRAAFEQAMSTPKPLLDQMRRAARESANHLTPKYGASRFLESVQVATNQGR